LLSQMRSILAGEYTQIPMLSSSRAMDLNGPFSFAHPSPSGKYRALLVGINYVGTSHELRGCHNDVEMMKRYLEQVGYPVSDMRLLLDDGQHEKPDRANIISGFQWLTENAGSGDSLFFHYSGHGASVRDDGDDEEDGKDECLCPCDDSFIRDDETYKYLVAPLKEGASLTCVLDCCHSGTILDLPYMFKADSASLEAVENGSISSLQPNPSFDMGKLLQVLKDNPALVAGGAALARAVMAGDATKGMEAAKNLKRLLEEDGVGDEIIVVAKDQIKRCGCVCS